MPMFRRHDADLARQTQEKRLLHYSVTGGVKLVSASELSGAVGSRGPHIYAVSERQSP